MSKSQIVGTYRSAPYPSAGTPSGILIDSFVIDLGKNTVTTLGAGSTGDEAQRQGGEGIEARESSNQEALNKRRYMLENYLTVRAGI